MMEKVKNLWSQVEKRTLIIVGSGAVAVWLLMVGLFWLTLKMAPPVPSEPEMNNIMAEMDPQVLEETEAGETSSDFSPQFREGDNYPPTEDLYAHRELMELYLKKGSYSRSSAHLKQIEKYFKNDPEFAQKSAEISLALGKYESSLEKAREALKENPESVDLKDIELHSMYRLGQVNNALALGEQFLKQHPNDLKLLTTLGMMEIESRQGQAGNARYLKKALNKNPKYVPALYQMGRKHKLEGNYADAKSVFKKAIQEDPANGKLRGQMGMVHYYLNEDKLAEKEYRMALHLNPQDFNTWYNLGELLLARSYNSKNNTKQKENRREAFESYQSALEFYPQHRMANFRVGVLLNGNNQFKEAIPHFNIVLDLDPEDLKTLLQIAAAYEHLSDKSSAQEYLQRAFQIDPTHKLVIHKLRQLSGTS